MCNNAWYGVISFLLQHVGKIVNGAMDKQWFIEQRTIYRGLMSSNNVPM